MKGNNNLIIAGKDCEHCPNYTYGDDKRVYCKLKENRSFFYGQYMFCEDYKESKPKRRRL